MSHGHKQMMTVGMNNNAFIKSAIEVLCLAVCTRLIIYRCRRRHHHHHHQQQQQQTYTNFLGF
jgi:hypothetical protein